MCLEINSRICKGVKFLTRHQINFGSIVACENKLREFILQKEPTSAMYYTYLLMLTKISGYLQDDLN